jgi:FMN phosphatase YigB (HAD superfamily)
MIADTTDDLLEMCRKIGVQAKWIQYPGTANEHFDICLSKKAKALEFGAKEIGFREYATMVNNREKTGNLI